MRSFYTQRFYKLICLHLPTDCFMNISLQLSTGHCIANTVLSRFLAHAPIAEKPHFEKV